MAGSSGEPPPGGGDNSVTSKPTTGNGLSATSAWAGGRPSQNNAPRLRTFEEIIAEASSSRNILEIHLKKNFTAET